MMFGQFRACQGKRNLQTADLYALAATLYELLTRRLAPDAVRRVAEVSAGQPDPLVPAHAINPAIPGNVAAVIGQALALFVAGWRRAVFILLVPLYYLLFQSFVHTEFRFTVPMQYFVFVFAATAWVAICSAIWHAVRRTFNKNTESKQPLAAA